MDLDMQSYKPTSGGGNYMIAVYLVQYGAKTFQTDAGITEIIRPSEQLQFKRLNPMCGEPRISIKNCGTTDINHLVLDYGWEGFKKQRYTWEGLIKFDETATIDLPYLKERAALGNRFECRVVWVNGKNDDYAENNLMWTKPAAVTPELPGRIEVLLRTNNAPSENYYKLIKSDGTVIRNKSNFAANKIYRDTVNLEPGCYLLNLMDDGPPPPSYALNEDGLGWWANSADGTGLFQVRNPGNNSVIQSFNGDFGTGIWYQFHVGAENIPSGQQAGLSLYPNPAHNDLLIDLGAPTNDPLKIEVYSASGAKILSQNRTGFLDEFQYLDVTGYPNGLYVIKIQIGDRSLTQKILLN
jgi:Secretion system C-terminal sorting domain